MTTGLIYQLSQGNLSRTNLALLNVQQQLATGHAISRASDDPIRAVGIQDLTQRLARSNNHSRNLEFASSVLGVLSNPTDGPLGSSRNLVLDARNIASDQIGAGSSSASRQSMAASITSILQSLYDNVNSQSQGLYLFGGSTPGTPPMTSVNGGYRYVGRGSGLLTDLGTSDQIPVTLGGNSTLGELSARQHSTVDLDPGVTLNTPIADLRGGRNLGVALGTVAFSFNGGPSATVDLTGCASTGDVVNRLKAALQTYETTNSVTILENTGVGVTGQALGLDIVAGGALTFTEVANGTTGADLGLTQATFTDAGAVLQAGTSLDPRLTMLTPVAALGSGVTQPLGMVRISQTGGGTTTTYDVDLSSATTIDQVRNLIESAVPGVRVAVNDAGTGLDIYNEIAGKTMTISDVAGGANTALELGIRTFSGVTAISDFNFGRGVSIVDGVKDPTTGLVAPRLNTDMRITLGNGQYFDVDLTPTDMTSVATVMAAINNQFTAAIGTQNNTGAPPLAAGDLNCQVSAGPNGFAFTSGVAGAIKVSTLNNSAAAEQLGLTNLTFNAGTGEYVGEDRSGVRVDNVFTHLIALRDALNANSTTGISLAGEDLSRALQRLENTQGLVASYAQRVESHKNQLADQMLLDEQVKSTLQDTDFADAAAKLSMLSTQLQATLQSVAATQNKSLFDYL